MKERANARANWGPQPVPSPGETDLDLPGYIRREISMGEVAVATKAGAEFAGIALCALAASCWKKVT